MRSALIRDFAASLISVLKRYCKTPSITRTAASAQTTAGHKTLFFEGSFILLVPLVNELGLPIPETISRKAGYAIGMSWPVRLHSRALPRESMETSERSNTRGLHLEFVCLRKVRQACDANAKAIRCLEFPSSLQPVYTRKVPCTRLCSSASRGAARMDVCRRTATKFEPTLKLVAKA